MTHTPGPWRLSKYGQLVEPQPDRTFRGDYDVQLSVAGGVSTPSGNGHPKRAEAIANRDLIVQAPAMKQALLDLVNWYDMDEGDLQPIMNAARVVLARVEKL